MQERITVEDLFKSGKIKILCATSTLAAGVNLPARRVIITEPKIGIITLPITQYRQMVGRAGRTGVDTEGDSILIVKSHQKALSNSLMHDPLPELVSCMYENSRGLKRLILEATSSNIVNSDKLL